jgi:hypothetical protein
MSDNSPTQQEVDALVNHPKVKAALLNDERKRHAVAELVKLKIDRDLLASIVSGVLMGG